MTNPHDDAHEGRTRGDVDPGRTTPQNPFDHGGGISGQSYHRDREEAMRRADPAGGSDTAPSPDGSPRGQRATIDPATGEARGSGAGAGGSPGSAEDYDTDPSGGSETVHQRGGAGGGRGDAPDNPDARRRSCSRTLKI